MKFFALMTFVIISLNSTAALAAEHTVNITQFQFQPGELTVAVGDTVHFINEDTAPHSAVSESEGFANSGMIATGEVHSVTFTRPGTLEVLCGVHAAMAPVVIHVLSEAQALVLELEEKIARLKSLIVEP